MSTEDVKPIKVKKLPLILSRNMISMNRKIKLVKSLPSSVQEDIIYTSKQGDFTSGEVRRMTIVNRLSVGTNSSKTIARCQSHSGQIFEKTSDEVTNLIGQDNYDILFSSLCSIINQELKIRSINALLTVPKKNSSVSCQTETNPISFSKLRNIIDSECQTMDTCSQGSITNVDGMKKYTRPRKRNKRQQLQPYVVRDAPEVKPPRRIVISPDKFDTMFLKSEKEIVQDESLTSESSLPSLPIVVGPIFCDEDSNNSLGRMSSLSVPSIPDLIKDPMNLLTNVDKHTRDISSEVNQHEIDARQRYQDLGSPDGLSPTHEKLPFGMQEHLKRTPPEDRIKMLLRQGLTDLKDCLNRDADGHLPIHVAVLTNDVDLLRRQCFVLKMRGSHVDELADGITPLRMSLFQKNTLITSTLLHFGADPLDSDVEDRTAFHIAAEMSTDHLQILINHCQQNAKKILHDADDEKLWKPKYECMSDEELAPILLHHINKLHDSQGYTPLMLASKLGMYNNVMALVESCRATVNVPMTNSGNTALYLAVGAACMDAAERGNKAKIVDHFSKTIEILVENGADPGVDNFAGSSVNDLLTEFNIAELSMLIANKLTSIKYFDGHLPSDYKGSDFMLVKDDQGVVNLKDMKQEKGRKYSTNTAPKNPPNKDVGLKTPPTKTSTTKPTITKTKSSPIIIENVEYKPPTKPDIITLPGNSQKRPEMANLTKVDDSSKQENVNDAQSATSMVKNFRLNKPIILKSGVQNNKRKLDMVVDSTKIKIPNKND